MEPSWSWAEIVSEIHERYFTALPGVDGAFLGPSGRRRWRGAGGSAAALAALLPAPCGASPSAAAAASPRGSLRGRLAAASAAAPARRLGLRLLRRLGLCSGSIS
jgi:hypothetical protein